MIRARGPHDSDEIRCDGLTHRYVENAQVMVAQCPDSLVIVVRRDEEHASEENDGETEHERGYIEGVRRARMNHLANAIRELRGDGGVEELAADQARWILEREEAVAKLRQVCAEFGDNDWKDDLHIADVIDKHLARYLEE